MWFANGDGVSGSWLAPWLCYRLPLGFCPWHIAAPSVSEHQVLWAFSGMFCLMTSSCRIRCGQMGEVPASASWPTSMFIPPQQPERGISSIAWFSSRSRSRAPCLVLGWGQCNNWIATMLALLITFRRKSLCHTQRWHRCNLWPCKFIPMEVERVHIGSSGLKSFYTWSKLPLTL